MDEKQGSVEHKRPSKAMVSLALTPLIIMTVGANVANALFPTLVKNHPVLLVALDGRVRNMLAVVAQLSLVTFFAVSIVRRLLFDPLYFFIGKWYGNAGVNWLKKRSPDLGQLVELAEDHFPRWGPLMIIVWAHPLLIVLAGASGMSLGLFMIFDAIGTIAVTVLVWELRDVLERPLDAFTDFISQYSIPLTVLSFSLVAFYIWRGQRKGESQFESISEIERELEEELAQDLIEEVTEWNSAEASHSANRDPDSSS